MLLRFICCYRELMGSAFNRSLQNYINLKVSLDLMKRRSHIVSEPFWSSQPPQNSTLISILICQILYHAWEKSVHQSAAWGFCLILKSCFPIPYEDETMVENQSLKNIALVVCAVAIRCPLNSHDFYLIVELSTKKASPDSIPNHPPKNFGAHLRSS